MSDNITSSQLQQLSDKMAKLINEKNSARDFQKRKHDDWNENYELYRNKVKVNRLTQRQAVNIPLMKETIKTLLSKVDDAPSVQWKEKSGDMMKEIVYQEIWNDNFNKEKLEWKDILDKKNVFLYGISTKKLNIDDKGVSVDVLDVYDIQFDPKTSPLNIETANFIIHQNIFRPLREILVDERYTKEGRETLKHWLATDKGLIQSGKTKEDWEKAQDRMTAMGVEDPRFSLYAGGDVLVNLTEHYTKIWNKDKEQFERRVVVYAEDYVELMDEKLEDLIGMDKWPFVMWCEDPETNDVYCDSVGDLIRTPNKILNVWFSQQVENRTLQNFQMHWYDATVQNYVPQTYEPGPGRMLPAPGDPSKTIMPVQVNGLDETFRAMDYLIGVVERGTGATALEKGQPEQGTQTLGEVQILVGKATERAKTMAKFYRGAWYDTAIKWNELMQNNDFPKFTLYKTGTDGKVYPKVVYNKDWKSEAGYEPMVASSSEQESDDIKTIQKFSMVLQQSPNNLALKKAMLSRELKLLDLSPAELKEIQEEEERNMQMTQQEMAKMQAEQNDGLNQPQMNPAQQPNQIVDNGVQESIKQSLEQIGKLTM